MKKLILISILFLSLQLFSQPLLNQQINIGSTYTSDQIIFPFNGEVLYGLAIDGEVEMTSESSLIRVVLYDNVNQKEFLVFETYPMLDPTMTFSFSDKYDETAYLDAFEPTGLKILINESYLILTTIKYTTTPDENANALQYQWKLQSDLEKIDKLNTFLESDNRMWRAGETPMSEMYFQSRKNDWGEKYFVYGYEYYADGIFEWGFKPEVMPFEINYDHTHYFDWRSRHNANVTNSDYYDGDAYGSGWMTSVKNQNVCIIGETINEEIDSIECVNDYGGVWSSGHAPCWAFSALGAIEAVGNTYFNDHIDFDLSEIHAEHCYDTYEPSGGYIIDALDSCITPGLVNEECFPYYKYFENCDSICDNWEDKVLQITGYNLVNNDEASYKNVLIHHGPLALGGPELYPPNIYRHAWVLTGYGSIEHDMELMGAVTPAWYSGAIGLTYWIMKNSRGIDGPHNGYDYMFFYGYPLVAYNIETPILNYEPIDVACRDDDNDGYFNWGIGVKPEDCNGLEGLDANDNDPSIGPLDENGFFTIIDEYNSSFEIDLNGWKQSGEDDFDWRRNSGPTPYPDVPGDDFTGPDEAQNGDYYIYLESEPLLIWNCGVNKTSIIESPLINFSETPTCGYELSFWYHKRTSQGNNDQSSKIEVDVSSDEGETWETIWGVYEETPCDDWINISINLSNEINKIRFVARTGNTRHQDIALDNINIIPKFDDDIPHLISGTIELDDKYQVCTDIIIEPNGILELTENCILEMNADVKIIIKPEGKLLINDGKITTIYNGLPWHGIQVQGKSNSSNVLDQGWVEIHGGTIENSKWGIYTTKPDIEGYLNIDDALTAGSYFEKFNGGVVRITDAQFINNRESIHLYPYVYNNASLFYRNHFFLNENYTLQSPENIMKFEGVKAIEIYDCFFENLTNYNSLTGICSINSNYRVDATCSEFPPPPEGEPCATYHLSKFYRFLYGIYAINSGVNEYIDVRHTRFNGNMKGIYLSGVNNARITSNNFSIKREGNPFENFYGLYIDHSSGYHIENNTFTSNDGVHQGSISKGLYINENGTDWNQIYNNTFKYLEFAIITYGINRNSNGTSGLCIECNDFIENINDIVVNGEEGGAKSQGIAYNQGYEIQTMNLDTLPAANSFTNEANPDLLYNYYIDEESCNKIKYVYHENNITEYDIFPDEHSDYVMTEAFDLLYFSKEDACPSKLEINGGGGIGLLANINEAEEEIVERENILQVLVDGGDTFVTNMEVVTAYPEEALELRNELLSKSPYLSDEVMQSAIENENVLQDAMLRDVLVANPQAAKSKSVMDAVYYRFNPLPDYMIAQILGGMSLQGAKDQIMNELAYWQRIKSENFNTLYKLYLSDEDNPEQSFADLLVLLENDNSLNTKYYLTMHLMGDEQYSEANLILGSIENNFDLNEMEQVIHQDYLDFFSILHDFRTDSIPLDSLQIDSLLLLTPRDNYLPGAYARNLLIAEGIIEYEEPINIPMILKSSEVETWDIFEQEANILKVYPNPANEYIMVEYKIDGVDDQVSIAISNMQGKQVYSKHLNYGQDKIVIETHEWQSGVYVIFLYKNGNLIKSEKVTIQ